MEKHKIIKTRETLKNAVWQYLEEHGKYNKDNGLELNFIVRNKKRFWKKIASRESGYKKII